MRSGLPLTDGIDEASASEMMSSASRLPTVNCAAFVYICILDAPAHEMLKIILRCLGTCLSYEPQESILVEDCLLLCAIVNVIKHFSI